MRLSTFLRPAVIALGCVALAVVPACSGGGDKSSSSGTGGGSGGSQKVYCEAVQKLFEMNNPYLGSVPPIDQQQAIANQAIATMQVAPPEVLGDLQKAITGDPYARDNVDQFNKSRCGNDTGAQRPSTP